MITALDEAIDENLAILDGMVRKRIDEEI